MTQPITRKYWTFYLMGRGEKKLLKNDIDLEALAKRLVGSGGDVRTALAEVAAAAGKPLEVGKAKRKWVDEHSGKIKEMVVEEAAAYNAWCRGRVDELAYSMEEDLVNAISDLEVGDDNSLSGGSIGDYFDEDEDDEDDEDAGDD